MPVLLGQQALLHSSFSFSCDIRSELQLWPFFKTSRCPFHPLLGQLEGVPAVVEDLFVGFHTELCPLLRCFISQFVPPSPVQCITFQATQVLVASDVLELLEPLPTLRLQDLLAEASMDVLGPWLPSPA